MFPPVPKELAMMNNAFVEPEPTLEGLAREAAKWLNEHAPLHSQGWHLAKALSLCVANTRAARPDEVEADEIRRFQDGVRDHLVSFGVPDDRIDGAGCDSGDPLDFTKAEITQVFGYIEDRHAAEVAALRGENERLKEHSDSWIAALETRIETWRAENEELKRRDAQSRESGCWCDEYGHPCKGCGIKQERNELSEEMESCHAMLDAHYQEDPESCSADTLEQRVQVHLTEANAIRAERDSLQQQLAELKRETKG